MVSLCATAFAADNAAQERKATILSANELFPAFMNETFSDLTSGTDEFGKVASKFIFDNFAILPMKNGFVLYSPAIPVAFVMPKKSIRTADKNYRRLFALAPNYVFRLAGVPEISATDSHLKLAFKDVPEALGKLMPTLDNQTEDEFKAFLDAANKSLQEKQYKLEAYYSIIGPYSRVHTYQSCIAAIDTAAVRRRVQSDLLSAKMNDLVAGGFEYLDFIPLTKDEAVLVMTAKANGTFVTLSSVSMGSPCRYSGETQYRAL